MIGLSRGSRTTLAFCACAATLNVPRLDSTRAVPRANPTVIILMPWPPCHTQPRSNSDIRRRPTSRHLAKIRPLVTISNAILHGDGQASSYDEKHLLQFFEILKALIERAP